MLAARSNIFTRAPYSRVYSHIPNPIPASFLRGGTSKGIFINRAHLPADQNQWDPIFLRIMGSPDPEYGRQLNGMGGGISSLSKICVVGIPSSEQLKEGIQAEYTFVQVGIRDEMNDYSGNCGNLSSMIGVFAVDEGICSSLERKSEHGRSTIRTFNTNTQKIIDTTFPISDDGVPLLSIEETEMAGVPGKASEIIMDFVSPGGARTGKLLPTGSPVDMLSGPFTPIRASLVDATNPTIFVAKSDLPFDIFSPDSQSITPEGYQLLESIRQAGSIKMGLTPVAQGQPKIAVISSPTREDADITIHALSMGVLHKAVPMTVGLCLGVAAHLEGSLAWDIVRLKSRSQLISIRHPGGVVRVGAKFDPHSGDILSASVVRTVRRLMEGKVWW